MVGVFEAVVGWVRWWVVEWVGLLLECVDTRFCTHDFIKEDEWNDHSCTKKIMIALHALKLFIAYSKNDLEILTILTVCRISKSDRRIERYHEIKFSQPACIVWGETDHM